MVSHLVFLGAVDFEKEKLLAALGTLLRKGHVVVQASENINVVRPRLNFVLLAWSLKNWGWLAWTLEIGFRRPLAERMKNSYHP